MQRTKKHGNIFIGKFLQLAGDIVNISQNQFVRLCTALHGLSYIESRVICIERVCPGLAPDGGHQCHWKETMPLPPVDVYQSMAFSTSPFSTMPNTCVPVALSHLYG